MFKKSLLALALAGVATSASAVEISTSTNQTVSVEGVAAATSGVKHEAAAIKLKLGAEYTTNDTITVTVTGGTFDEDNYKLTADGTASTRAVTWGIINKTSTSITFRATSLAASTDPTTGGIYSLTDGADSTVEFAIASIGNGGKVTIKTSAKTNTNLDIDTTDNDSKVLFTGATQYAATLVASNGVVDVTELRKKFNGTAPTPSATFTETTGLSALTETGYKVTLTGDFTGVSKVLELGADGVIGGTDDTELTVKDGVATLDVDAATVPATLKFGFSLLTGDKAVALTAPQTITAKYQVKVGSTLLDLKSGDFSKWSLNGASQNIDFLPFQEEYARAVTVTNRGTVEGDIHAEIYSAGKMVASAKVGTATKYAVTDVSAELNKLAADNGVTGFAGVRLTVNSPEANIDVNAIYYHKADKDRVKTK